MTFVLRILLCCIVFSDARPSIGRCAGHCDGIVSASSRSTLRSGAYEAPRVPADKGFFVYAESIDYKSCVFLGLAYQPVRGASKPISMK
jgi:hypothetical protein